MPTHLFLLKSARDKLQHHRQISLKQYTILISLEAGDGANDVKSALPKLEV